MNPIRKMRGALAARKLTNSTTPIGDRLAAEMGILDDVVMLDRQLPPLHRMSYERIGKNSYAVSCDSCDRDDIVTSASEVAQVVADHSLEQVVNG